MSVQQFFAILVSWTIIWAPGCRQRAPKSNSSIQQIDFTKFKGFKDLPKSAQEQLENLTDLIQYSMTIRSWDIVDLDCQTVRFIDYNQNHDEDKEDKYLFAPKLQVKGRHIAYKIKNQVDESILTTDVEVFDCYDKRFIKGTSQSVLINLKNPLKPQLSELGDMLDYLSGVARVYFNSAHPEIIEKFEILEEYDAWFQAAILLMLVSFSLHLLGQLIHAPPKSWTSTIIASLMLIAGLFSLIAGGRAILLEARNKDFKNFDLKIPSKDEEAFIMTFKPKKKAPAKTKP